MSSRRLGKHPVMADEPRKHPRFMVLVGVAVLGTIPLPFVGSVPRFFLGMPLWLWWSAGFTVALSFLVTWGFSRYWKDGEDD